MPVVAFLTAALDLPMQPPHDAPAASKSDAAARAEVVAWLAALDLSGESPTGEVRHLPVPTPQVPGRVLIRVESAGEVVLALLDPEGNGNRWRVVARTAPSAPVTSVPAADDSDAQSAQFDDFDPAWPVGPDTARLYGVRSVTPLRIDGGSAVCQRLQLFRAVGAALVPVFDAGVNYQSVFRSSFGDTATPQSGALDHERIEAVVRAAAPAQASAPAPGSGSAPAPAPQTAPGAPGGSALPPAGPTDLPPAELERQTVGAQRWQTFRLGKRQFPAALDPERLPAPVRWRWDGLRYRLQSGMAADAVALRPGCS